MIGLYISKVLSTTLESARRIIKATRFGATDTHNVFEVAPYGYDANPPKGMKAIFCDTGVRGKNAIIGYINTNQVAAVGATRLYSTDANGAVQFELHLKNDGNCELGGNADNAVRYAALNAEMQKLAAAINVELGLIATGISGAGGAYTKGTISIDISGAKIDNIKTP